MVEFCSRNMLLLFFFYAWRFVVASLFSLFSFLSFLECLDGVVLGVFLSDVLASCRLIWFSMIAIVLLGAAFLGLRILPRYSYG